MYKVLFLIRHGNTLSNCKGVFDGVSLDSSLSIVGCRQAEFIRVTLQKQELDAIYCSSLKRAIETAQIINRLRPKKLPIIELDGLREINFGEAEGKTREELHKKYTNEQIDSFIWTKRSNWEQKFDGEGSESKKEAFERVYHALKAIVDSPGYNIVVIMHAGVLHALEVGLGLRDFNYDNCAINLLYYDTRSKQFFT